ncbi:MAG: 50S ribosomal protein L21e [Nanoarchaeota archaeon]|nr:50S ribosomal protein L21e [Nanoarchaeota archaeon]
MVKKSKGLKSKTRKKISVKKRNRGKLKISDLLKNLKQGDRVLIKPNASYQFAFPHRRYFGKIAMVKNKRGSCYSITVKDGNMEKTLVVCPAHLRLIK